MSTTYETLPLRMIQRNGRNPRKDVGDVTDLAASIQAHGLLEPLVVAPIAEGVEYVLIAGHRRMAALEHLGLDRAEVLVRRDLDTPAKQLEAMLIENTQRTDLTFVEEADAYAQLVAFSGYTPTKAAKNTGRSVKTVKQRLAIAGLDAKVKGKVGAGTIPLEQAVALTEWTGKDGYDRLVQAAGTANFTWTLQRLREEQAIEAARALVEKYAAEKGWPTVDRRDAGTSILDSWNVHRYGDRLEAFLTELDGDHVFATSHGSWALCRAGGAVVEDDTDDDEPEWKQHQAERAAEQAARAARTADLNTAAEVRKRWLAGRLAHLVLTADERVEMVRLLLIDFLGYGDISDADATLAGLPTVEVDESLSRWEQQERITADWVDWARSASENELWRALLTTQFGLATCGISQWNSDDHHKDSTRVAVALGYEPSDIERELLEPVAVPA